MSEQPHVETIPSQQPACRRVAPFCGPQGLLTVTGGAAAATACAADGERRPLPRARRLGAGSPSAAAPTTPESVGIEPTPKRGIEQPYEVRQGAERPERSTSKVPVGGGVILNKADYVITQPTKGKYKAFTKICTHQGCAVAEVANGVIHCDCHGSEYSIKDGSVVNPPASKPLAEHKVTVSDGKVFVTD